MPLPEERTPCCSCQSLHFGMPRSHQPCLLLLMLTFFQFDSLPPRLRYLPAVYDAEERAVAAVVFLQG